jgi:hypothetical protein
MIAFTHWSSPLAPISYQLADACGDLLLLGGIIFVCGLREGCAIL